MDYEAEKLLSEQAFQHAIDTGRLSLDETANNYAGKFMFMGHSESGRAQFKNINTREYLA